MPEPLVKRLKAAAARACRRVASESEVVALHTSTSPMKATSPYHEFARCPPTALFGKPCLWPGPEGSATTARLLWSEAALYVCWELEGVAALPIPPSQLQASYLAASGYGELTPEQRSVMLDARVECFLWQQPSGAAEGGQPLAGQIYHAFGINYEGKVLPLRVRFGSLTGFELASDGACSVWTRELPVGWGGAASPVPSAVAGASPPFKRIVVAEFQWRALGIDPDCGGIRVGLHRVEHSVPLSAPGGPAAMGQAEVGQCLSGTVRTSWVDPGDREADVHHPELFGALRLQPAGLGGADCSCCAARLLGTRALRVLPSPIPSLAECPAGALLVQARYASLCGSDLPYFKDSESKAPSCYWDRDGFCGHEVIGVVVASKSGQFKPGDPVLSLPSSYFKAHAGSKQEWFREEVHGVLLENFPVRGGFSEVFTSHELYSYKIEKCEARMLAAQGLGTILRMARRVGPVLGKTVVVIGQGQNGLLATRLMSQFCAKHVIAVEPLEYRRQLALTFGATQAVAPGEAAAAAVASATGGRGADVVLEMVGHNQDTINEALEHVACAGIVAAFGVPDDKVYDHFEYTLLFRKNVSLIASVIPDPGTDFPEAVRLIEQGRFSTEGLFSHVLPLAEVQKAFTMAAEYADGVVKLVVDFG